MRAMMSAAALCIGWALLGVAPADTPSSSTCCVSEPELFLNLQPTTAPAAKVDAKKAFAEISKALAGKWKIDPDADTQLKSGESEFKLTSGGSVLMETMLPGTPMEMVNLYAVDRDDLLVTHYCAAGNQPRMRLTKAENGVFTFEFKDGTNLTPEGSYMGGLTITIADGKVLEKWTHFAKGKVAGGLDVPMVRQ